MLTFTACVVLPLMEMQMQGNPWKPKDLNNEEDGEEKPAKRGRKPQFKAPEFNR